MSKTATWLTLFAIAGWGAFTWAIRRPSPLPKIVERVQYVDRVVEKVVQRETKKPDGTVVKEVIVQNTKVETQTKEAVQENAKPPLSRYSLGLGVMPLRDGRIDLTPTPVLLVGYRPWEAPIWVQVGATPQKDLIFQVLIEF